MKELVHTQQQILDNFLKDDHRCHLGSPPHTIAIATTRATTKLSKA